ncbi:hypothetical protein QCA50_008163 [Cerrena zonata]|uniref:Uncharacterized protein n=1 Tax=Cerrena zonata TaxID=2478898 RepID=A0AAW0GBU2_9APHY
MYRFSKSQMRLQSSELGETKVNEYHHEQTLAMLIAHVNPLLETSDIARKSKKWWCCIEAQAKTRNVWIDLFVQLQIQLQLMKYIFNKPDIHDDRRQDYYVPTSNIHGTSKHQSHRDQTLKIKILSKSS